MSKFVAVANITEIPADSAKCIEVEGKRIALFNLGGQFYALDDTCTHRGGPLSEGTIEGEEIECPWHGARFNIKSGGPTCHPAVSGVTRYNVRVAGNDIEVEL